MKQFLIIFALISILAGSLRAEDQTSVVILTWQGDTGTTMTVNTHTTNSAGKSQVYYDTDEGDGTPGSYRFRALGASHQIVGIENRYIHVVELTDLEPGRAYYFVSGDNENGFSEERKFRTIASSDAPIRFVSGGDMGIGDRVNRMLRQAAAQKPHFALIGGDIAYANGRLSNEGKWDTWLKA